MKFPMGIPHRARAGLALLSLTILLGSSWACSRPVPEEGYLANGFLGDYSHLEAGGENQAQRIYIRPDVDFGNYSKILIEPVTVWRTADAPQDQIAPELLEELADYALYAFHQQLHKDFQLVQKPGPKTMALRIAITEESERPIRLMTASERLPRLRVLQQDRTLPDPVFTLLLHASIEMEIVDTVTGQRLAAAVDGRAGETVFPGDEGNWIEVESAFDHWANRLATRLVEEGFGKNENP